MSKLLNHLNRTPFLLFLVKNLVLEPIQRKCVHRGRSAGGDERLPLAVPLRQGHARGAHHRAVKRLERLQRKAATGWGPAQQAAHLPEAGAGQAGEPQAGDVGALPRAGPQRDERERPQQCLRERHASRLTPAPKAGAHRKCGDFILKSRTLLFRAVSLKSRMWL